MNCCWCGRVIDRVLYFTEFESLWPYLNGFHSKVRSCRKLTASDQINLNRMKWPREAVWLELAKFRHFGYILRFLLILLNWTILNLPWQSFITLTVDVFQGNLRKSSFLGRKEYFPFDVVVWNWYWCLLCQSVKSSSSSKQHNHTKTWQPISDIYLSLSTHTFFLSFSLSHSSLISLMAIRSVTMLFLIRLLIN